MAIVPSVPPAEDAPNARTGRPCAGPSPEPRQAPVQVSLPATRAQAQARLASALVGAVGALVLLGSVYRREGLLARAEATLTRALAQNPGDAAARRELSLVREDRGAALPPQRHGWAVWVMRHVGRAR